MTDTFYKAFEDRFRGSQDAIKQRLSAYRPFLRALKSTEQSPFKCLDIGCGRGEWLELLGEAGFDAFGVDLDRTMVEHCLSKGLRVEYKDALMALKELPANSLSVVSGFHIVEHLPFDTLREIVQEAFRVLSPFGFLIFETPNPENILVGCNYFYLDPTHSKPIPMQLLSFLVEHYGFERVKALRLNAPTSSARGLLTVFTNVSPDYAVIGQKHKEIAHSELFDGLFNIEMGESIGSVTRDFDRNAEDTRQNIENLSLQLSVYNNKLDHLETRLIKISKLLRKFERVADQVATLQEIGFRRSSYKLAKKIVGGIALLGRTFIRNSPILKRAVVHLLPKSIFKKLKLETGAEDDNVIRGRSQLSQYANDFYNSLKSARAQK